MKPVEQHGSRRTQFLSRTLKGGLLIFFMLISVLIAACGAGMNNDGSTLNSPQVTVTINFRNTTPFPTRVPFKCGAWVTNTTPGFQPGNQIAVYLKFVRDEKGNPVGVANAQATATITWADQQSETSVARTTADGLAVVSFAIPSNPALIDRNNSVTVTFAAPDGNTCTVNQNNAAFFTLIQAIPTPMPSAEVTPETTAIPMDPNQNQDVQNQSTPQPIATPAMSNPVNDAPNNTENADNNEEGDEDTP